MITSTTHFILNVKKAVSSRQVWHYLMIRDCKVKQNTDLTQITGKIMRPNQKI